jgi:tetratricopeptide (TPR) repeat protein
MSTNDGAELGFEGWLRKLGEESTGIKPGETFDPTQPMDDLTKLRWLMAIDRRYMLAMPKRLPGRADETVARELEEICADYERLLQAGPSQSTFFTTEALREKIADLQRSIASTYGSLRRYLEAGRYFEAAAQSYAGIGKMEQAQSCRNDWDRLQFDQDGNLDDEIQRLRDMLSATAPGTLDRVQALIELGVLYSNGGDDYEAEELLREAEKELSTISDDPSGVDLATALKNSLLSVYQGQQTSEPAPIVTAMQINGLYRQLYQSLARIHETKNPQLAAEYRQKAAARDSRKNNDEFSEAMLKALENELGKLT